jgi:hypothetical protein
MSRWQSSATAQNPFASNEQPRMPLTLHEDLLEGTSWVSRDGLPPFLSDTEPDMTVCTVSVDYFAEESGLPILSALVGVAANTFLGLRSYQVAPTASEGFARLHEMKNAAQKLALLARGGTPSAVSPSPYINRESLGPLGPRTPGLHAFLHDLLREIDQPDYSLRKDPEAWNRASAEAYRRDRHLLLFFGRLDEIIKRLTFSDKEAADTERLDSRTRKKGVPRDGARDWIFTRLMWIWRDVVGRELAIYLPRIGKVVDPQAAKPLGDTVIAFICDAMKHLEPIKPPDLSALEKKLIELRPQVPASFLMVSDYIP